MPSRRYRVQRPNNHDFVCGMKLSYAQVMEVMGALNAGGFSNIGLVTDIGGPALDGSDTSGG